MHNSGHYHIYKPKNVTSLSQENSLTSHIVPNLDVLPCSLFPSLHSLYEKEQCWYLIFIKVIKVWNDMNVNRVNNQGGTDSSTNWNKWCPFNSLYSSYASPSNFSLYALFCIYWIYITNCFSLVQVRHSAHGALNCTQVQLSGHF